MRPSEYFCSVLMAGVSQKIKQEKVCL